MGFCALPMLFGGSPVLSGALRRSPGRLPRADAPPDLRPARSSGSGSGSHLSGIKCIECRFSALCASPRRFYALGGIITLFQRKRQNGAVMASQSLYAVFCAVFEPVPPRCAGLSRLLCASLRRFQGVRHIATRAGALRTLYGVQRQKESASFQALPGCKKRAPGSLPVLCYLCALHTLNSAHDMTSHPPHTFL